MDQDCCKITLCYLILNYFSSKLTSPTADHSQAELSSTSDDLHTPPLVSSQEKKKVKKKKKTKKQKISTKNVTIPSSETYCMLNCKYDRSEKGNMIRCSLCLTWFHIDCLNINEEEANRFFWPCPSCRTLLSSVEKLNDNLSELRKENNKIASELAALRSDLSNMQTVNNQLTEQLRENTAINKDLESKNAALQEECRSLQDRCKHLRNEHASISTEKTKELNNFDNQYPINTPTNGFPQVPRNNVTESALSSSIHTLFVGDSIIRDVSAKTRDSKVICQPGITIEQLRVHLRENYTGQAHPSEIILEVGTNDCSQKRSPESILADYKLLLKEAKQISEASHGTRPGWLLEFSSICQLQEFATLHQSSSEMLLVWRGRPYTASL
ncbi:uncharacterized protein [Ptychodera flava]|uniref:uncharacterized protein n=1 Tax=Ptychodera flava TaxID=63121 RepID=UPI003969F653